MKSIGVVTDSHSSITQAEARRLGIYVLPMPFYIDGQVYYEDITLSREDFFEKLDSGADISTSQPSPSEVMQLWDKALEEFRQILYIPISSGLSGSCATAAALAPFGIRVVGYIPGMIVTPISEEMVAQYREKFTKDIALGRLGRPEDLAKPLVFLASDAARYITGIDLEISGGKFTVQDCAMPWRFARGEQT